ncbi:MAG: riboflavin synthase [Planctomycetota bacterium]|jgi:riboflavin synthase
MFTGLIEGICRVKSAGPSSGQMVLSVDLGPLADDIKTGDSIAVNGACLTVTKLAGTAASFDISSETLERSALGTLQAGWQVNVERALKPSGRLGGHIVQGHIDGTGLIRQVDEKGRFRDIKFSAAPDLLDQMVIKGSVAVDGVSLTIADIDQDSFSVSVIPESLKKTTLGQAKIGGKVNIETDIIVKIIKKQLDNILPKKQDLTIEKLKELGF